MSVTTYMHWGKADGDLIHPAVLHMIDAGITAGVILKNSKNDFLRYFQQYFYLKSTSSLLNWLIFLTALHDIGKISPMFQKKREDLVTAEVKTELGLNFNVQDFDHSQITYQAVMDSFGVWCADDTTQGIIASVLSAHHGYFKSDEGSYFDKNWQLEREDCIKYLAKVFKIEGTLQIEEHAGPAAMMLCGLISVSDWIASDSDFFNYHPEEPKDIYDYISTRTKIAENRINNLHMGSSKTVYTDFCKTFGFMPNDCQIKSLDAASELRHPMLIIVESPMGSGKTEAALGAYAAIKKRDNVHGLFYGLPTQATGNQMYPRVEEYLKKSLNDPAELHLIHSNSDLNDDYHELKIRSVGEDYHENVYASQWFCASKRGLTAQYGVGTIDQALMAVIRVRHMFVRLFGLSGKVVILDEIHAYDVYTETIIRCLLEWLSLCRTSVILLSATLPEKKKCGLISSFNSCAEPPSVRYPCIFGTDIYGGRFETAIQHEKAEEPIIIKPVKNEDISAQYLNSINGCTAVILNTVHEAQKLYLAVKDVYDGELTLFHARFTLEDRINIERHIMDLYGKDGKRPIKGLVIATQVIEQSLDIDFDRMITGLCPIDLLLQRAGRLHRHKRQRLCARELMCILPDMKSSPDFGVDGLIYFKSILLKTALLVRDGLKVRVPEDISELIEKVYGDEDHVPGDLDVLYQKWITDERGEKYGDEYSAMDVQLNDVKSDNRLCKDMLDDLAGRLPEERVMTRNGRESIDVAIIDEVQTVKDKNDAIKIFKRRVNINNRVLVEYFKKIKPPEDWEKFSIIRNIKPLVFKDSSLRIGKYTVSYSSEVGLLAEKEV